MAARLAQPRRGDVWLVDFDPTLGAEIKKTRLALIIQNDVGNRVSPVTIVAAITSALKVDQAILVSLSVDISAQA